MVDRRIVLVCPTSTIRAVVADDYQLLLTGKGQGFDVRWLTPFVPPEPPSQLHDCPWRTRSSCSLHRRDHGLEPWNRDASGAWIGHVLAARGILVWISHSPLQARCAKTVTKRAKFKILLHKRVNTNVAVGCVVNRATCYGAGVTGASDSQISCRRALAHGCLVANPGGRSATVDFHPQKHSWHTNPKTSKPSNKR